VSPEIWLAKQEFLHEAACEVSERGGHEGIRLRARHGQEFLRGVHDDFVLLHRVLHLVLVQHVVCELAALPERGPEEFGVDFAGHGVLGGGIDARSGG
jgi:hypothetical protein